MSEKMEDKMSRTLELNNIKAQAFYKKMGFIESGCIPGAFRLDDGECLDEIAMYKILSKNIGDVKLQD